MPLFKTITTKKNIRIFVWKITESFDELHKGIILTNQNKARLNSMKSKLHQKGFLSIRHLLKEAGYTDNDITYDNYGKPHVKNGGFISITHSFIFSAIIVSKNFTVGIDIEKQRDKILKIAPKFTPVKEYRTIANYKALVSKLTIVWGAKESLYKIYGKKKLLFLHHIFIDDFSFAEEKTTGSIRYNGKTSTYEVHFLEFEGFTCVYAF